MSDATKQENTNDRGALVPSKRLPLRENFEREMERMMDDLWRHPFAGFWDTNRRWPARTVAMEMPVVDVYEEKGEVVVKAEVPGLSKDDLSVNLSDSVLTIEGSKSREEKINEKDYCRSERAFGSFSRSVELPAEVKDEQVKATFKNGVLEIRLPKTEESKKRVVKVKID
jgi:HSP20 family protein